MESRRYLQLTILSDKGLDTKKLISSVLFDNGSFHFTSFIDFPLQNILWVITKKRQEDQLPRSLPHKLGMKKGSTKGYPLSMTLLGEAEKILFTKYNTSMLRDNLVIHLLLQWLSKIRSYYPHIFYCSINKKSSTKLWNVSWEWNKRKDQNLLRSLNKSQ